MTVSGGTAPYSYSVVGTLPAGLTLNATTGAVTGTPTAAGSFSVQVTDAIGEVSTGCAITINTVLAVSCGSVSAGEIGVSFNSGPMTVSGGTAPYSYSVVGTLPAGLTLNATTGAVTGTPTAAGSFSVQVKDALGATSTGCAITINTVLAVSCGSVSAGEVGVSFNSGAMTVSGGTAPYSYSVVGTLPTGLTLNTTTGAVTGTPTAAGSFSVQVKDAMGATSTGCAITISTVLTVSCGSVTAGEVGVSFNSGAMTVSGGTAPYTFSIVGTLPVGLTLNTSTGAVTGTPTASGSFKVQVKDALGTTSTGCAITISAVLTVSCGSVSAGEVGVSFNSGAMTVSGGTAPYSYSIVGTLPGGLTLNTTTGAVTGTPTAAGSFSVQVKDALGVTGTSCNCAITINAVLTVSCGSITAGEVGVSFNSGAMTVSGGTAPYTFSIVGTLPAGLTLNKTTGAVTGTPTAAGSFKVQVKDALGATSTGCMITINTVLTVSCGSVSAGEVGVSFNSGAMTVSGGTAPYTFSIVGTLPAGLTLNTTTGAVTGTPTASGSFKVQVKDALGVTGTSCKCAITISAVLTVSCGSVSEGEVGVSFNSGAMTVSGGTAPYSYSIVGTLPAGLTLNTTTGAVTGTPKAAGSFKVQVKDARGATSTGCAITISAVLAVSCGSVTAGEVGVSFNSGAMTVSGGTAPYTFSIVGTLPAGLTLNTTTGAVTGTPTASGSFKVQVKDALGVTGASCNCAITISAVLTVSCGSVSVGVVGVSFNSGAMTVSGGTAPYTFSIVGTLPAGLTLNKTTGAVTGTPTASGSFKVQVKDALGATSTGCAITMAAQPGANCLFGVASAYNLIALTGNISDSADITGRIAAAGQVTQATTIGTALRTSDPYISLASENGGPWAIVAAEGIPTSNSFNVNAGGNVYSSTSTNASFNFANENYSGSPYENSKLVTGGTSPINFSTLLIEMHSLTAELAALTANGVVCSVNSSGSIVAGGGCPSNPVYYNPSSQHYSPSWIVLYGTSTTINIFNITQAEFQNNDNLDIEVPTGSTVIINVAGTSDTLQRSIYFQGNTVTDANASYILFNFPSATSVKINGQFDGTLLAPYASLSGGSQMGGTFIAASIGSTGEVHYDAFTSTLPITGSCSQTCSH
jgi:choice-of-anchor A domain-containing protein